MFQTTRLHRNASVRAYFCQLALVSAVSLAIAPGKSMAQQVVRGGSLVSSCAATNANGVVALRAPASKSELRLCEGHPLAAGTGSPAGTPLALASADFDEDGVPDLVSAFGTGSAGSVTVHRGNIDALWPYGAALRNGPPAAFLPNPRSFSLPAAPDFVAAGDFDGDGHMDIVTAARGQSALYFLKGNGHGSFAAAKRFELAGSVTDLVSGEMNRPDGLADLAIGVTSGVSSSVLVYQSPLGALKGQPESFAVAAPATSLGMGKFSSVTMRDLVIGAGNDLVLVRGRERHLSTPMSEPVAAAMVTRQTMNFSITALAAGEFTKGGFSVAVLDANGSVHILEHAMSAEALINMPEATPSMQAAGGIDGVATGGTATVNAVSRVTAYRQAMVQSAVSAEWTESSSVTLPNGASAARHGLVGGHVTGSTLEDLLVVDQASSQVHVLSSVAGQRAARLAARSGATASAKSPVMSMLTSLSATSNPVAVLPMRLSQHGLSGLVALQSNMSSPVVMPQDVAPTAVFTVTNTLDITDPSQKNSPPAGSLRAAMENAESAAEDDGAGIYSIVFNIPTSDPGYNSTTGVWKIQPLSENVPGSLDNFALPPINNAVTIDGYTQPGASPNTLVNADNAKIVIQIDGSKATTPGGSGFSPYFDTGTVIRGMALTGWLNPAINSAGTASGGMGIELNGVSDFVEGNFIGTVDGKTAAANRIGIFADNGPLSGNIAGNIVGGTTPQARNIISANNVFGIAFLSIAFESALQGNFVGLDSTGLAVLPNVQDGVGMNGPTVTIGGTLPGDRNYIAGNTGTNIDINDLTNGSACTGSYIQGNYIGTDATGTVGLTPGSFGLSIVHNCKNYLVGGTTASARNILSGNLYGVAVEDGSTLNLIQGNYIGTDPTGTVAVPNVQYGVFNGNSSSSTSTAAVNTTIGGTVAGAGNVISGNGSDGVSINGSYSSSPSYTPYSGSTVQGNFIGTDVTGTKSLPNKGNGVSVQLGGTNNTIGGTSGGQGNVIANNSLNGVLIDSTSTVTPGSGNVTVANTIFSNGGAGVRVKSGTGNRISANSIYGNSALGIDIDAAGPGTNTHCNATNSGANMLQNYPVLTAGTGSNYITATATDSKGNTSEFSKAVQATQAANVLSLLGSFDGTASSTFTIEFFSNPSNDPSGYGQGKTYLGSTTINTDANCSGTIADPIDLTAADVSVTESLSTTALTTGPDFGTQVYNSTVTNNGPATAHNVMFTDTLPAQLQISSTYCNKGPCMSPIVTSQGTCTVSGKTITCNLGTLAAGVTARVGIPVQALATGSFVNTVSVMATETDPKPLNNVASLTENSTNPDAEPDHIDPAMGLVTGQPLALTLYGEGFLPTTTVTFNGTSVPVTGVVDNQTCGTFTPEFCTALQITVPASLVTGPGTFAVVPSNAGQSFTSGVNYTAVAACTYSVNSSLSNSLEADGTNLIADTVSVYTGGIANCPWTAVSNASWLQILDNASASGSGTVDIAVAPNTTTSTRMGSITVAGQTFSFTQDAGNASVCSVNMDPPAVAEAAAGGTGTINATLSASGCAPFVEAYPQNYSATPNAAWITVTSSTTFASGPINYTVAPNNGPARVGAIVDGGNATIITQAAPSCYFVLSPGSTLAAAAGATGSINVTAVPSSCSWTATPSDASQVTITGGSGTGNGTVNYTVAANTGNPRTPTINIGNAASTSVFTISQASPNTCTFTISPTPTSVTSLGTSNYFIVTASFSTCQYTAVSNDPDSLAITGGATGTGTQAIYYSVAQNTSTVARTLTITAGCQTFTVNQSGTAAVANNPTPTLTSLSPSGVTAGGAGFTLTVNGTGFVSGAAVNFNGTARTTTYLSATQLTIPLAASDVASAGTPAVTVTNPTPGGGTSNSLTFTISAANNSTPVLTSLSPSSVAAGSAAFTLTVNGTGFVSGATVNFNGTARVTTYVSATQVTAAILASDIASAGTPGVTVTNPTPGGGTSNSLTFTISAANNPTPVLTSLSPASATAGSAAFTLTVNGTGFASGAVVKFNGAARTTAYVSATQLTAAILASDIASVGTPTVTVTNPTPGGGISNSLTFTISAANNPTPVLTSLSPMSVTAGSAAFTLTVNGTGFVSGAVVNFNGTAKVTTYVSATQVTAAILAADVASAGTPGVTVTNPTPGGGSSNSLTFTVTAVATNPVPSITSLQPNSVSAGSAGFTLTVNGTGFISGSTVTFNGVSRMATFVSSTQLTVSVLAADVANTGTAPVVVTNPSPGGGASSPASFTITGASIATFALSSNTATQAVIPGGSAQYSITVSAVNGTYSNPITLSASGLPPGATVTFSPASVTPGSTSATSTMTVQTPAAVAALHKPGATWPLLAALFPLLGVLMAPRSRRGLRLMLLLMAVCCTGALTGCGGGISYFGSHPQTYNITVTGTTSGTQQSTTIKLTVNY
jgi:redox-regulated HSP33 family molecular chaperone